MELELCLGPNDAARLPRHALLAPLRSGKARSRAVRIVWHDSADRALALHGLTLAEQHPGWRLERLVPDTQGWPPGQPSPVLASGRDPNALGHPLPAPLVPIAAFAGRSLRLALADDLGPVELTLLNGSVHAVTGEHPVSRLRLDGSARAVQAVAMALAGALRLAVPRASLAGTALGIATGVPPRARRLGPPELPAELSVGAAFSYVVGHLTDVILYDAPSAAEGQDGPEPVHQMRVAVRRLRSAIKVFGRALRCPALDAADVGLKALASKLAPTRDWDVFVTETAASVVRAFPAEQRLQRLLAAAGRRRRACHDELRAFLSSAEFRCLGIELACLAGSQEWQATLGEPERAELDVPLHEFAARVLDRRMNKLERADHDLAELDAAELHAVRLRAKRLRYAAEIFAPLHPGKPAIRFIHRLSTLQNRLGSLNDAAVAAGLLGDLAGSGGGHAFATGLILGFAGAHAGRTRERMNKAWRKFHRSPEFWR
jgi:triphosphatase